MAKVNLAEVVDLVRSQLAENWHHHDAQHREYLVAQAVAARSNSILSDTVKALTLRIRSRLWNSTWLVWLSGAVMAFLMAWLTALLGLVLGWPLTIISVVFCAAAGLFTWKLFELLTAEQKALLAECDNAEAKLPHEETASVGERLPAVVEVSTQSVESQASV